MKTFISAAIAALAFADTEEKLKGLVSTTTSNEGSFSYSGDSEQPMTTVSYKTIGVVEKLNPDQRKSKEVTTQYMVLDFKTKIPEAWKLASGINPELVVSAEIEENSKVVCRQLVPTSEVLGDYTDQVISNWKLGASIETYQNSTSTLENTLDIGPWVGGGGSEASESYKEAYKVVRLENNDIEVNCQVIRMIGDIPSTVYESSSLRYGWGEVPDFKDVPENFKVTAETYVWNYDSSSKDLLGSAKSTPQELTWINSYSGAYGLTAAAAGLAMLASMMF